MLTCKVSRYLLLALQNSLGGKGGGVVVAEVGISYTSADEYDTLNALFILHACKLTPYPSKHNTLTECCLNSGAALVMLARHLGSAGPISRVRCPV